MACHRTNPTVVPHSWPAEMSTAVLIQQASGAMRLMLELAAGRHGDYCARHCITYWPLVADVQFSRPPHRNKIALIQQALALGFETIAWLDADTLIVRDDEDLRGALGDGPPLGLAQHPLPGLNGEPTHWNSSVMILRNTPQTREFFDTVWTAGAVMNHQFNEQACILDLLKKFPHVLQRLDDRWNSTAGVNKVPDPVIKTWGGIGTVALAQMYDELKRSEAIDARVRAVAGRFVHSDSVVERAARVIESIAPYPDTAQGRGIVICAGGAGYFTCAWVCIHQLRRLGCQLPIQIWHLGPGELDARMRSLMAPLGVECIDADVVRQQHPVRILNGWELKTFAILHCPFREVLFLDADNVPVLNPEFLFDTPQLREGGAIFWPDFGRMKPDRFAWKIFDVPFRDEPEFESGQMVIDKARCWRPLSLAMWFNEHSDFFFHHIHGDKDTFRFAWHRLGQRFAMPPFPLYPLESTMCQHDFSGRRIFQHRNTDKWNFYRDNKLVDGFLFQEECQNDVRRLRELWDGRIAKS
jgi:hypothetical protein